MAIDYCSVEDVKLYLSIHVDDDNALLERLASAATAIINVRTKRNFGEPVAETTKTYFTCGNISGYRNLNLWVSDDMLTVSAITNAFGDSILLGDVYILPFNSELKTNITIKTASQKVWGYGDVDETVTITGKFAYSLLVPEDIRQAAIRLVAWMYRQKDGGADLDRPLLSGDGTVILPAHLPHDVEMYIKPYIKESA